MTTRRARQKPASSVPKPEAGTRKSRHQAAITAEREGRKAPQARNAPEGQQPAEKNKGGRPTIFSQAIHERIVKAIQGSGAYVEVAAAFAGISKDTFYEWMKKGRQDKAHGKDTELARFSDAVEKAMAESEISDLLVITNAARGIPTTEGVPGTPGNWQAAAWKLERKHPERYGRRVVAVAPDSGGDKKAVREPQFFLIGGQVLEV